MPDTPLSNQPQTASSQQPAKNADISGTPAEGIDLDPRYIAIKKELEQKWLQEHPGKDFLSYEGQNYRLGHQNINEGSQSPLLSATERLFRERYVEDARAYDIKEKTRIYENPIIDPAVKRVESAILKATNLDQQVRNASSAGRGESYGNVWDRVNTRESINRWNNFVDLYPEKARAYAEKGHVAIKRIVQNRERKRLHLEKQTQNENPSSLPIQTKPSVQPTAKTLTTKVDTDISSETDTNTAESSLQPAQQEDKAPPSHTKEKEINTPPKTIPVEIKTRTISPSKNLLPISLVTEAAPLTISPKRQLLKRIFGFAMSKINPVLMGISAAKSLLSLAFNGYTWIGLIVVLIMISFFITNTIQAIFSFPFVNRGL